MWTNSISTKEFEVLCLFNITILILRVIINNTLKFYTIEIKDIEIIKFY